MKMNRIQQQIAAAERRADKARAHAERMAQHAERRTAVALWEASYSLWNAAGKVGPRPIHPDDAGTGMDIAAFKHDMKFGHIGVEQRGIIHTDCMSVEQAARELGITL